MKKMKKTSALILALALIMAMSVPAFADSSIGVSGGSASVPVLLTTEAAVFSASVPTCLPVCVDADGTVHTADDVRIINNSNGQIKVASAMISAAGEWQMENCTADFSKEKTNAKKFSFMLQETAVPSDGNADVSVFPVINGGEGVNFTYNAKIANQSSALSDDQIANVVFTLAWNT